MTFNQSMFPSIREVMTGTQFIALQRLLMSGIHVACIVPLDRRRFKAKVKLVFNTDTTYIKGTPTGGLNTYSEGLSHLRYWKLNSNSNVVLTP